FTADRRSKASCTIYKPILSLSLRQVLQPRRSHRGHVSPPVQSTYLIDTPLEWTRYPELRAGIRCAETRLSDLICQNYRQALEFKGYGKNLTTSHGSSSGASVQMAFQVAYYGSYSAVAKAFLHGRTEAIRTVQPHSAEFVKRERESANSEDRPLSPVSNCSNVSNGNNKAPLPAIFTDPGWSLLSTSILSTSNCGNPALRLFGFGPVAADGYGIGYIIKDDGLSV
ncbi:hypothetical protein PHLCEN_2v3237, partial [Hermanssonia centrifuga]